MRVIVPGHRYALANLKSEGETTLQFYQDGEIHGETVAGTSCQEVLRALIERVQRLDEEKPSFINEQIISGLRRQIALFEARALIIKSEEGSLNIETLTVGDDGHLAL